MAQLRQDYAQFVDRQAEILVVCPEELGTVREYWQRQDLPFVGLADPDHRVADRYGQEVNLLKLGRMPELLVLDQSGAVRYVHQAAAMSDIPENKVILALLDQLNGERT